MVTIWHFFMISSSSPTDVNHFQVATKVLTVYTQYTKSAHG